MGAAHEDGHDRGHASAVRPPVPRTVLHNCVAGTQLDDGSIIELERHFARDYELEVDRVRGMHARVVGLHIVDQPRRPLVRLRNSGLQVERAVARCPRAALSIED